MTTARRAATGSAIQVTARQTAWCAVTEYASATRVAHPAQGTAERAVRLRRSVPDHAATRTRCASRTALGTRVARRCAQVAISVRPHRHVARSSRAGRQHVLRTVRAYAGAPRVPSAMRHARRSRTEREIRWVRWSARLTTASRPMAATDLQPVLAASTAASRMSSPTISAPRSAPTTACAAPRTANPMTSAAPLAAGHLRAAHE